MKHITNEPCIQLFFFFPRKKRLHTLKKKIKCIPGKIFLIAILFFFATSHKAQSGLCSPNVPFFSCNLSANPNGVWVSNPPVSRNGNCCGTQSPDRCIEFQVTLHPTAVAINFQIASGAIPPGAMFYQVNCGPQVPVGQPICISGVGPHTITFCKPGNNLNTYQITSYAGPAVSPADTTGNGCSATAYITGVQIDSTITWSEITSGTNAYLSYLDCTKGCDTVHITPQPGYPPFVDYIVCAKPTAPCYPSPIFCDTVRIYFVPPIQNTITPNPAEFCANSTGVTLTGTINGGLPPYLINWVNSSGSVVGTSSSYFASAAGTYSMVVYDKTYPACPSKTTSVNVTIHPVPIVNAGPDKTVCATSAAAQLNGVITNASGGTWSGGTGVFSPSNTALNAVYTASAADIANGSVILTLTSSGNGSCAAVSDQVKITIDPQVFVSLPLPVICFGQSGSLTAVASGGGSSNYTYAWSTGAGTQTINNVYPGTYAVTVSDGILNGCSATQTVTVTENPPIYISAPNNNLISCDVMATINVSASGGSGISSYLWNTGATTPGISGPSGTYIVTVYDNAGCSAKDTIVLTAANSVLTASVSSPPNLCYGTSTTLQASASGGYGNYSFSWNNNMNGSTITVGAGSYCAIATDAQGCMNQSCVTVTQSTALSVSIPNPPLICNNATATVTANPVGGTGPYSFYWSNGQSTQSITAPAGTYSVTVADANTPACTATATVTIQQTTQLNVSASFTGVSCFGGNNGTATANASGSVGPYNYLWAFNSSTNASVYGLAAGTYAITVTDNIGCTKTIPVTIPQPPPLSATISGSTNVSCYGGTNGSATVVASGGTPSYSYFWTPYGGSSSTGSGLAAGTYVAHITDSKGCSAKDTIILYQPLQLTAATSNVNPATCYGASNGSASVSASGGTGAISYYWLETGGNTANQTGLGAGNYNIMITDGAGCTANTSVIITSPPPLNYSVVNVSGASCNGGSNGSALVSASGGTPSYTFYWPTINYYGAAASNLPAGNYPFTITDVNGCATTSTISISQPTALVFNSAASANSTCNGACNGSASASLSGGVSPYSFQWSSGQTSASINGLCAGSYSLTVTDNNGCIADTNLIITQPPQLNLFTSSVAANCFHPDGAASVTASGGSPGYSYSWNSSPVQYNSAASNLFPGNYIVTVNDMNNCVKTATVTVANTPGVTISSQSANNTTCSNNCNGSASINAMGGNGPYSYSWSVSPSPNSSVATGLCPGNYMVIISDANNCTDTASFSIAAPAPVMVTPSVSNGLICAGDATLLSATASGGTGSFTFNWNNGTYFGQNYSVSPVSNTTYSVVAADNNGCQSAMQTVNVITHAVPVVNAGPDITICSSAPVAQLNGSVANATGGTWSGGSGTFFPSANTLNASYSPSQAEIANGQVTLALTSTGNGPCSPHTDQITIKIATQFTLSVNNSLVCFGQTGSLTANVSGGVAPYNYMWSNGATTPSITNTSPGTYSVSVTDAVTGGCNAGQTASINQNPQVFVNVPAQVISCSTTANITATASGGTGNINYLWNTGFVTPSISAPTGTYIITATDASGCQANDTVVVNAVSTVLNVSTNQPANLCNGASANLTANATGGFGSYSYSWSNGSNNSSTTAGAGIYSVIATDLNGCKDTTTVTVTQSPALTVSISGGAQLICNGATATLTANPSGGQGPYNFSWSTGQISSSVTQPAGAYSVNVSDANTPACSATATITVNQASALLLNGSSVPVKCNGGNDGAANAFVSGSVPPYSFSWTPSSSTSALASNLQAGIYSVTVTDSIGCSQSVSVTVTQPSALTSAITSSSNVSCFGGNNGSASVTPSGGTPGYTYQWSPTGGNAGTALNLPADNYSVSITDANGCTQTNYVTLTQPPQLVISTSSLNHVSCYGGNNGSAAINASGGSGTYSYLWQPSGGTNFAASNLNSNTYTVYVTDNSGCSTSANIVITQPAPLADTVVNLIPVSCNGSANGAALLASSGGTPGYTFYWPTLNAYGPNASGLAAGTYNYSITDSNGCSVASSITINQPSLLTFNTAVGFDAGCNGGCDGMAVVVPGGGQGPYSYQWNTGQSVPNINNLCAGTYSVQVTDANGCTHDTTVVVGQPTPLAINISTTPSDCNHPNGTANANASGGSPGYTYSWNTSPPQNNQTAAGLVPGNYTVTITDNNGCTHSETTVIVNQPGVSAASVTVNNTSCSNYCNGTATITGSGGTGPYSYSWNTSPPQTNATAAALCPGSYTVIISDFNNCSDTAYATISSPPPVTLAPIPTATVICNGDSAVLYATASGGTGNNYVYSWNNGAFYGQTWVVSPSSTTSYSVVAIDNNGCFSNSESISVTINPALTAVVAPGVSICQGGTAYLTVAAAGGNGNYTYTWMPGNTNGQICSQSPPASTTYSVLVTDGCSSDTASIPVTVYPVPAINFAADITSGCAPLCLEFDNTSTVSAGDSITGWSWNFGDNDSSNAADPSHCFLESGTFDVSLTAMTAMGCSVSYTFSDFITVRPSPYAAFTFSPPYSTQTNSAITFSESAADETSYAWSFGDGSQGSEEANPTHSFPEAGNYCVTLTVKNNFNCTDTATHCLEVRPEFTFYIPNAFTPNGNGKNEYFTGKGENIAEYKMLIFDRWGDMIFETDDLSRPWDGRANGGKDIAQQDVYVYLVDVVDIFGEKHQFVGHVTLLR
jgi:gliding motility-associated-like protein